MELPYGRTLVSVFLMSDGIQLTGVLGVQKTWPIYMTLANIKCGVWAQTSYYTTVIVSLLYVSRKLKKKIKQSDKTSQ